MKKIKYIAILLAYILLLLTIKNIQIILPILFEYKEIIGIIISYLFSVIAIVLNCIFKSHNNANKINNKRNNEI